MESEELRFEHVSVSNDGAVIFCAMDNGQTFAMSVGALEKADCYDPKAKPKSVKIIHDGYAAIVHFDNKANIDFPSDFARHICDPSYAWHKDKVRRQRKFRS